MSEITPRPTQSVVSDDCLYCEQLVNEMGRRSSATEQGVLVFGVAGVVGGATGGVGYYFLTPYLAPTVTTLGLGSAGSSSAAPAAINITAQGLQHVLQRHAVGGVKTAGKSVFKAAEDIVALIRQAESVPAVQQAGRTTFQRVVDAGRTIGVDRTTGQPTSVYTVITNAAGKLITAFPGMP